jgi:hypothetical protein
MWALIAGAFVAISGGSYSGEFLAFTLPPN